ncbi:unnamed protein product [Plutella xylostella]|uniref:(diamondback moth) hypothetical protein n=1 Tax=Plutella xylostella TaxID=51655 RepID=A0A8S4G423_PLUXY|nr:unnamed protein product [Plutella xylostella]
MRSPFQPWRGNAPLLGILLDNVAWLDADTGQERVLWREIDKLSRVVFPALFLLFVTMYWPVLLLKTKTVS